MRSMRMNFASDSSTPSPGGSAPPDRPVPAPRATTGTFMAEQVLQDALHLLARSRAARPPSAAGGRRSGRRIRRAGCPLPRAAPRAPAGTRAAAAFTTGRRRAHFSPSTRVTRGIVFAADPARRSRGGRCGASRKSKLISPVPGSLRPGTSAICMWPMRGSSRSMVSGEVAFHDLHVEEVVLQEARCRRATASSTCDRLRARAQEAVGTVRALSGSISARMPSRARRCAGVLEVRDVGRVQRGAIRAGRHHARPCSCRRGQRTVRAYSMARSRSSRNRCSRPGRQAMPRSPRAASPRGRLCSTTSTPASRAAARDLGRLPVVRVLVFDRAEAGLRRGGEALEEVDLGEQHRNVGGEFRHRG